MVVIATALTTCGKDDNDGGDENDNSVELDLSKTIHPDEEGAAELIVTGTVGTPWTMQIVSGEDWISLDRTALGTTERTGVVGNSLRDKRQYIFYWPNTTKDERHAVVRFTFQGQAPVDFELIQYSVFDNSNVYTLGRNKFWPEIPAEVVDVNYTYVTHTAMLTSTDGKSYLARNFTLCFDRTKKGAWWVAYPLHKAYTGTGRTETWAYDPKLKASDQADLSRGFPETYEVDGKKVRLYDRGHQIPNADRSANKTMQAQTFYFSNMTAQRSQLNQQPWAKLEEMGRGWMCSDTLYVVTGAAWTTSKTTTDYSGQKVPVPDYYFKVFVRTVAGNVRTTGDKLQDHSLKSIGFWVANEPTTTTARNWACSVEEVEANLGNKFSFFPEIPADVKKQKNLTEWGL